MAAQPRYDDGVLALDGESLVIRGYYFPFGGAKTIRLADVRAVVERPMGRWTGQWRIWGSSDFRHWWNLDVGRPHKTRAFAIDAGSRTRAAVTPDDPDAFGRALEAAGVAVRRVREA